MFPKVETTMRAAFSDALITATTKPVVGPVVSPVELLTYSAIKRGVGRVERRKWWSVQRGIR